MWVRSSEQRATAGDARRGHRSVRISAAHLALSVKQPDQHGHTACRVESLPVGRALHDEVCERTARVLDAVGARTLSEYLLAREAPNEHESVSRAAVGRRRPSRGEEQNVAAEVAAVHSLGASTVSRSGTAPASRMASLCVPLAARLRMAAAASSTAKPGTPGRSSPTSSPMAL